MRSTRALIDANSGSLRSHANRREYNKYNIGVDSCSERKRAPYLRKFVSSRSVRGVAGLAITEATILFSRRKLLERATKESNSLVSERE